MSFGNQYNITWENITEPRLPEDTLAPIDRQHAVAQNQYQADWKRHGVVVLKNFLPNDLVDQYCQIRARLSATGGYPYDTPYLHIPELLDLSTYPPLMDVIRQILDEDVGLHLNLTGWVSTERNWHQDSFLNPEFVGSRYIASWMALSDIHPDSGPFQFIPGSHEWDVIRQHKLFNYLSLEESHNPAWPNHTQDWLAQICEHQIEKRKAKIITYLPKKNDVLLWHSNLIHRGSRPNVPGMERRSLISHYSTLSSRADMPIRKQHSNGSYYFWFDHKQPKI